MSGLHKRKQGLRVLMLLMSFISVAITAFDSDAASNRISEADACRMAKAVATKDFVEDSADFKRKLTGGCTGFESISDRGTAKIVVPAENSQWLGNSWRKAKFDVWCFFIRTDQGWKIDYCR